jgi:hypothetical protein
MEEVGSNNMENAARKILGQKLRLPNSHLAKTVESPKRARKIERKINQMEQKNPIDRNKGGRARKTRERLYNVLDSDVN